LASFFIEERQASLTGHEKRSVLFLPQS